MTSPPPPTAEKAAPESTAAGQAPAAELPSWLAVDRAVLIAMRTRGHDPRVERFLSAYSKLGEHAACWIALGLGGALVDGNRRRRWLRGCATVAGSNALNFAIKLAVRRRRPQLRDLPPLASTVSGLSFPSAHTTTSFAAARAYRGLVPSGPLYAAASVFAFSRPYLGVHYPSDVLGGILLGTLASGAAARLDPGGPSCR